MFPLNEIIETGSWLRVDVEGDPKRSFQFRPTSFSKIDMSEVDNPEKLDEIDINSNIWLLNLDIINLSKREYSSIDFTSVIYILDEDSCAFSIITDSHLMLSSKFAKVSGLNKFFCVNLRPKIGKSVAIAYQLPDFFDQLFFDAQYYEGCNISVV
ncbi:MAG: hypothetical protein U1C51_04410 [Candidatus Izemoplasmatales bacterium]|nr:hypothetical protein [Methylobacter sp.]MDP2426993.1 hypothetical protein [Methylobacter sp.]MDP3055831.1 hypothetical protein [Methylobacter sp.]MDP3361807.1 hypothetical protein [Methylobacter sp.]MDZ4196476.1 hypothetical protein [Candidatus Izemoplasmatales bacterium]